MVLGSGRLNSALLSGIFPILGLLLSEMFFIGTYSSSSKYSTDLCIPLVCALAPTLSCPGDRW